MGNKKNKRLKKKLKAYDEAMEEASVVEGPANILGRVRHKGKILGKYNALIY